MGLDKTEPIFRYLIAEILYPKTENMNAQKELNPFGFGLFGRI